MRALALLCFNAVTVSNSVAGTKSAGNPSACAHQGVFIDRMTENFGQYVTTEIMAQGVSLDVTSDDTKAACIMRGTVVLGGFRNTGSASLQIVDTDKKIVWSATSGDKDSVKDLAHNLVKQLKHDLQNPKK